MKNDLAFQQCINPLCRQSYPLDDTTFRCSRCGSLLDILYDWDRLPVPHTLSDFEHRWLSRRNPLDFSGVWRFRALFPFAPDDKILSVGEGQTLCLPSDSVAQFTRMNAGTVYLQYEGLNPSGSFKDNGMTAAFTHAHMIGASRAACASTGNTSASLALYCAVTKKMSGIVFIGSGKIAHGKLAQALDHGVLTLQILGDFDDAIARVQQVSRDLGIYLVNSINPFRLEGQKSIMYRVLESLAWLPPDWIIVPGGNLGNCSAFAKAFHELHTLGLIPTIPRLAVINAAGANTFFHLVEVQKLSWNQGRYDQHKIDAYYAHLDQAQLRAHTLASAIEINRPVNLPKALRALEICQGVVREVEDTAILDAKAQVAAGGFGCEPASAASVAGLKLLREQGVIAPSERVVCILTAHSLKDPSATIHYHLGEKDHYGRYANRPQTVPNDLSEIIRTIQQK